MKLLTRVSSATASRWPLRLFRPVVFVSYLVLGIVHCEEFGVDNRAVAFISGIQKSFDLIFIEVLPKILGGGANIEGNGKFLSSIKETIKG